MTNKNLKLAAMSVALTACVAAQPLVAHAVDAPAEPESKDPDPKAALEEGADLKGQEENAPEGKDPAQETPEDQVEAPVNQEADKKEQEPAFAPDTESKDVEIDYKDPQPDPKDPDTTITEGAVIDTSKKDEESGKTGKIGEATKTETVDPDASTTEVEMGKTTTHPDGSTTTPGTQTTTDQGSGEAKAETETETQETGDKEKDPEKGQIDLNEELGEDRSKLTWDGVDAEAGKDQEEKAKYNGYTIQESKPSEDGNSKELTLKKTSEPETKKMSAEDVAKLLDVPEGGVEKKTDDEGKTTYILKKEETSTDENGNTVTRVTYYKITDNTVETTTETTLVLKVEKGTVDVDNEDLTTEIKLPSITAKNTDETKTDVIEISSEKLGKMLDDKNYNKDTGEYVYTETVDGKEYTYKVKKTENTKPLTPAQLAERLGEGFTADDNGVYYKGEKLNFDQMKAVRKTLSYTVEVTEVTKTPGQEIGKDEAEAAAKTEAIKDALRNAAKQNGIELTEDELKGIKLTGGDLIVTRDSKKYTFHYTKAGVKYSAPTATGDTTVDGKEAEDVKETTVTGTAYVTNGTISWSKTDQEGSFTQSVVNTGSSLEAMPQRPDINDPSVKYVKKDDGTEVYTVTTKKDGITTETIYTFKNESVTLTDPEKEAAAWKALAEAEHKSVEDLQKEGYKIDKSTFNDITKTSWTVETKTSKTEKTDESLNQKILKAEGDPTWTLEGTTLKIKDGDTYKDLKKNADGTYTATKEEDGKTVTYTFTLEEKTDLDEPTIKAMLAKEFPEANGQITLNTTTNTATYKKADGSTVTIDYSNLSKKTLKIDTSVHDAVSEPIKDGDDDAQKAAEKKLLDAIEKKRKSLKDDEELWIGDLKITKDTKTEDIIAKFTTAVSHTDMSPEALIKALNDQARIAKTQTVTVNEGTKYEEKLKNYYSGDENLEHNPKEPPTDWYGNPEPVGKGDHITHLDLASGAKMDKLADKNGKVTKTDCVLLSKGLKLEWNYSAENLLADQSTLQKPDQNHKVGLEDRITKDTEDGKGSHYEYNRDQWYDPYSNRWYSNNNNPDKSAFYKLTGTVAYDALTKNGEVIEYSSRGAAIQAYRNAVKGTTLTDEEILGTYVVPLGSGSGTSYQVYTKTAEMTSYGYMTRDANTCVNNTFGRQYENSLWYNEWDYVGGYDLMIKDLVQVEENKVVGQTQSSIKTLWAPLAIRSTQSLENKSLQLDAKHTSTPVTTTQNLGSGYQEEGSFTYDVSYTHTDDYASSESQGVQGTGTDKYKTFTLLVKKMFSGKGDTTHDEGKVSYTHRTTDKVNTTPVSKETETTTNAHVGYNYTSIETRTVTVNGEETVIVPPVTPPVTPEDPDVPPVQDETVVTPETPELPPVQDATPDDAAPETPVLPSDAVLPAVQDATALPQTGVNWMAALGMAFSGMLLTIAGAFASLKYKEKH